MALRKRQASGFAERVRLNLEAGPGETLDAICGGTIELLQRRDGYRFNLDAILLAHFAMSSPAAWRGPFIDLGTGSGVVALILARKFARAPIVALEIQPSLYALAERSIQRNRVERKISLVLGDIRRVEDHFAAGSFGHVLCNPPYRAPPAGRLNPERERAIARHALLCTLADVARAAGYLLANRGALSLIYPAARLCELLELLREFHLEPKQLRMVHPKQGDGAKLALVHAVKAGGEQLEVSPPLWVHGSDGARFSDEVMRMLDRASGWTEPDPTDRVGESSMAKEYRPTRRGEPPP